MKKRTDFIFITLVYRNYNDLYAFCDSLKQNVVDSYEVVIVDAFYDNDTSSKISKCAKELECYYIQTNNGGYGYGNNQGFEYVKKVFEYKYVFVCNPDTVLKNKLSLDMFKEDSLCIAPKIISRNGKNQNPYWVCENRISEYLMYKGYQNNNKIILYIGIGINKIIREIFNIFIKYSKKSVHSIYACHGSFFALNKEFLENCQFRYDEKMFLFYEEAYLAKEIKKNKQKVHYYKDIIVFHNEDGSMSIANIKEYPHLKKSYIHYYEKYRKNRSEQ